MLRVKEIWTDGSRGATEQAEHWARSRGIGVQRVTATFRHEGPASSQEQNATLVALARAVIAFPGDEANDDLVAQARKAKRDIFESPGRQLANLQTTDTRLRHLVRLRTGSSP